MRCSIKKKIDKAKLVTNYFRKQCSSSSFLLTWSRYTGPKWLLSTEQASPLSKIHTTSLLSTPWPFWTGMLSQVSKNYDEKTLLLGVIWLYWQFFYWCSFQTYTSLSYSLITISLRIWFHKIFCIQSRDLVRILTSQVLSVDIIFPYP